MTQISSKGSTGRFWSGRYLGKLRIPGIGEDCGFFLSRDDGQLV